MNNNLQTGNYMIKQSRKTKLAHKLKETYQCEIEWLFYHLWSKPAAFCFKIPDTVVLRQRQYTTMDGKPDSLTLLDNWYFTSQEGFILKKNRQNLTVKNIREKFVKGLNTNFQNVAASLYHYDYSQEQLKNQQQLPPVQLKGKSSKQIESIGRDRLILEHIATHDINSFTHMLEHQTVFPRKIAYDETFKIPQIIQKFVYCKSSKNQMFRVRWRSNVPNSNRSECNLDLFEIVRSINNHSMYDIKVQLCDRIHTFESLPKNLKSVQELISIGSYSTSLASSRPSLGFSQKTTNKNANGILSQNPNFSLPKIQINSEQCLLDTDIDRESQKELKEAINQIRDHLNDQSGILLTQGTFYFKFDTNDDLYLIYCAGLKAQKTNRQIIEEIDHFSNDDQQEPSLATCNKYGQHPILRTVNSINTSQIEPKTTKKFIPKPPKLQNQDIQNKYMEIKMFQNYTSDSQERPKVQQEKEPQQDLQQKEKEQQVIQQNYQSPHQTNQCPFCCEIQHPSCPMIYELTVAQITQMYSQITSKIPWPIQRVYSQIDLKQLQINFKQQNFLFNYQQVKLCDDCFEVLKNFDQKDSKEEVYEFLLNLPQGIQENIFKTESEELGIIQDDQSSEKNEEQATDNYDSSIPNTNEKKDSYKNNQMMFQKVIKGKEIPNSLPEKISEKPQTKKPIRPQTSKQPNINQKTIIAQSAQSQQSQQSLQQLPTKPQPTKKNQEIYLSEQVGFNTLQKLETQLKDAGYQPLFVKPDGKIIELAPKQKFRPYSSKVNLPKGLESSSNRIINIVDKQIQEGKVLQNKDIDSSDNKTLNLPQNKLSRYSMYQISCKSSGMRQRSQMQKVVNKQRQARGSDLNFARRQIIQRTSGSAEEAIKELDERMNQINKPLVNLLGGDKEMSGDEMKEIAKNADNLIQIISSIKNSVENKDINEYITFNHQEKQWW